MRKLFLPIFCGILFILFSVLPSYAQETSPTELESCFAYYNYGKIKTHLASEKQVYTDNETIRISGTIENQNTFPIVGVTLYAHLRRLNVADKFETEGHILTDRIRVLESLSFLPGESKWIEARVPVKTNYPKGSYQLQYYIFSPNGFHYSGRPFLEEDVAGYTNFDIDTVNDPSIYFDLSSLTVNGGAQTIRGGIKEFPNAPVTISVNLVQETSQVLAVPVHVSVYSFDDSLEENKVDEKEILVKPSNKGILTYTFTPREIGAYVIVAEVNEPVAAILKYRFAITGTGTPNVRLNDLNITDYPVGTDTKAYLCFHSPAPVTSRQTEINLSVLDNQLNIISQKSISGNFDGSVQAISVPIGNIPDTNNLTVKATLTDKTTGQELKTTEIFYSCDTFSDSIKDIQLTYDEAIPDRAAISALGICNTPVENGYIEQIRVLKDNTIVKEDYHKTPGSMMYELSGMDKGVYTLDVKSGQLNRQLSINLKKTLIASKQTQKDKTNEYIIGLIIIGVIILVIFFLKRVKRVV